MKNLLATLALLASACVLPLHAADAPKSEPKQNTISSYRIFPKEGHNDALKAAITAHVQKYHTGAWSWRVSEVLTGPDGGSYHVVEGPNSWSKFEERGDLGAEHSKDFDTTVLPHVEKITPDSYSVYQPDASSVAATQWSTKSIITHYYVKPGRGPAFLNMLKGMKAANEKAGLNIVVWSTVGSGEPQFAVVRRFKNGWKDFDEDNNLRKIYEEMHGVGSWDSLLDEVARDVSRTSAEFIEFRPELSSK